MAVSNVELRVNATQAVQALKNVDAQSKKFNTTISGTSGKLKATTGSLKILPKHLVATGAGAKAAGGGVKVLGNAIKTSLGFIFGITTAVAALGKVFQNLAQQDFAEAKFRTLGGNSQELVGNLKTLSNELSGQASVLELTGAAYDVASAGFTDAADAAKILKAASLGATGGFTDINTSGGAAVKVLNAYGKSADDAAFLMDQFAQTQADGIITIGEYSNNIGKVATTAAGLGVPLSEINAVLAQSTAAGTQTETAFSGLNAALAKISSGQAGKKLGIEMNEATLAADGLGGTLAKLQQFSTGELQQAFGIEAFKGIQVAVQNTEKFNELLENQINAQGRAAKSAFEAQNTIQGQVKRLSVAFTNLTTEGSEIGIILRESLKIAAVTVEALGVAVKLAMLPFRQLFAVVGEIGKVFMESLGMDAVGTLISLEQGWIGLKEAVTDFSDEMVFVARVVGGVIGNALKISIGGIKTFFSDVKLIAEMIQRDFVKAFQGIQQRAIALFKGLQQGFSDLTRPVVSFFTGLQKTVGGVVQKIVNFYAQAFRKIVDLIPEPLKKLLGGIELPKIDLGLNLDKFENPFKDFKFENPFKGIVTDFEFLKEGLIEFSGIEREIADTIDRQAEGKKKVTKNTEELTEAQKKAKTEADKLKETFKGIGESVRNDLVSNLSDAITGAKSFGDAMRNVLGNLKKKLLDLALNKAISGIGKALSGGEGFGGGFLSGLFGKERGGPVSAGGAYVVGERGPELLQMGSKGGNIVPNSQLGGGGDSVTNMVTVNVDASGSAVQGSTTDAQQLGQVIGQAVQAQLIKEKRAGGLLA